MTKPQPSAFSLHLNWVKIKFSLHKGDQFIYKALNSSEWRMAEIVENGDRNMYDFILVFSLDSSDRSVVELPINNLVAVHKVPKGSKKEVATILYGN